MRTIDDSELLALARQRQADKPFMQQNADEEVAAWVARFAEYARERPPCTVCALDGLPTGGVDWPEPEAPLPEPFCSRRHFCSECEQVNRATPRRRARQSCPTCKSWCFVPPPADHELENLASAKARAAQIGRRR